MNKNSAKGLSMLRILLVYVGVSAFAVCNGATETWRSQDIGVVGAAGSFSETAETLTVSGSGADIFNTADAFQFVYQAWNGDGEIIARVAGIDNVDNWSKAGPMFRESLAADARNVFVMLTPQNGVGFQCRTNAGGLTGYSPGLYLATPTWLKLARIGSVFQAYQSADGSNWVLAGAAELSMPPQSVVGIAVTSHHAGLLCNATFSAIALQSSLDVALAPTAPKVTGVGPDRVALEWTDNSANEEGFEVQSSADGVGFGPGSSGGWTWTTGSNTTNLVAAPQFLFTGGNRYYFRVRAVLSTGSSPWSEVVDATTTRLWSPWQSQDVGPVGAPGSVVFGQYIDSDHVVNNVTFGSGAGIGGAADAFQFMYIHASGNGTTILKVGEIDSTNALAQTGLMLRQSLDPGSAYLAILATGAGTTTLKTRAAPGGVTLSQPGPAFPITAWFKITRDNSTFTIYVDLANDYAPVAWQPVATVHLQLTDPIYLGVAASSGNPGALCRSIVYNLSTSMSVPAILGQMRRPENGAASQFTLSGVAGETYAIEASSDLVSWASFSIVSNSVGTLFISDPDGGHFPRRFYRALQLP